MKKETTPQQKPNIDINNCIRIPTSLSTDFFKLWMDYLTPLHHLTDNERNLAAAFLKERLNLEKKFNDKAWLNRALFNKETTTKIKEECGISTAYYQVLLSKLRKVGFFKDEGINPIYIPKRISKDSKAFMLMLYFDLNAGRNKQAGLQAKEA